MSSEITDVSRIKTYGGLFATLLPHIKAAVSQAQEHFGTQDYFRQRSLKMHQAFDSWCEILLIPPLVRTKMYYDLKGNLLNSQHATMICFQDFFNEYQIPKEFLVRGKWVSPRVWVSMSDPSVT